MIMYGNEMRQSQSLSLGSPDLTFPFRIFLLLKQSAEQQMEHIISWTPDGKAFKVHDPAEFEKQLLAKNFKMKKYASFTRQLCAYGFSCVRKGRQTGIYYHLQFSRNNINACFKISRRGGKGYASAALKKADKSKFEPEDNVPLKVSTLSPTFPCVFGQGNLLPQHRGFSVAIGGPHQPSKTTLPVTSQERNFMREDAEVLRSFYKHMRQVSGSSSSSKGSSKNLHIASPSSAAPSILPPLSNPEFDCSTSGSRRRQDQATSHGATLDGSSDRVSDDANFSGTGQQEMLICEPRAIEDMLSG